MKYEEFVLSVEEYGATLTEHSHQVLYWLNRNGYLNNDNTEYLLTNLVVVPIRNHKGFGRRLLDKFFNKDSTDNAYVFPITLLENDIVSNESNNKPTLTLVK
jgi:hypothetical protein